jgi:hypothetical protein
MQLQDGYVFSSDHLSIVAIGLHDGRSATKDEAVRPRYRFQYSVEYEAAVRGR